MHTQSLRISWVALTILALLGTLAAGSVASASAAPVERTDVLIGFAHTPGNAEQALVRAFGGEIKQSYRLVPAIAASVPVQALNGLRNNPLVTVVEPDGQVQAIDTELDNTWGVKRINAGDVQTNGNTGAGVKVAVIDSGVDYTHPELAGAYAGGWDFVNNDANPMDDNGHGTHVAGTIVAAKDGSGVVGVAPGAKVYALKVLNASGSGSFSNIIAALQWATDNGIQVTNNSYGSGTNPGSIVEAAFNNADAVGVLNIAAAGNSGTCAAKGNTVEYPAAYASVVAVAATDQNNARPCFSSSGPAVEISAPGVNINSTKLGGGYTLMSGTSMATPHVVGAAALVLAANPADANSNGRVNDEVRSILNSTATDLGVAGRDSLYGYGLVNALAAVAAVSSVTPPPPPPPPETLSISVDSITYSTSGGKTNDKDLTVAVLVASAGVPVAGASVSIDLYRNSSKIGSGSAMTGSDGTARFSLKNAPSGCYSTTVTKLSASGYSWVGATPSNSFCK